MTSRQRVQSALSHRQPDRIPLEFGSTAVTGMHVTAVAALREHYGLEKRPVKVVEPYQMLGEVDDELAEIIGIDVAGVAPRTTLFGFPNENWREWRAPFGLTVLVPEGFRTVTEPNGDVLIFPQGDTSVPPSGRMPAGGYFFDTIVRQEPIDDDRLDVNDNLEEFQPVTKADLDHFAAAIERAAATGRAVMASFGGTAFGDIALVPAPFLKRPRGIRDIAEWYMSTVVRRDYVHAIFEAQCNVALENLARIHAIAGDQVDAVFICGTDFGTQTSAFCSVETFRELYMPYYKRVNDWIHAHTNWKTFKHSCGAVENFLPWFIECGFDILNPVQCSAAGMEPRHLKRTYGDRLTFWGGGVDTQKTLPFGTPQEVREQVLSRCEIFGAGGGFVFNAIHNVQARVPVANIVAMIEAVKEFNGLR
ncbi:MAG TPA: uroporphyrinogen decarboxylase family protein [Phycisphaerae bacterium]|nr:uroporphyrinogen decarboxylase family protein [Phycisphaerae bacterium]HOJ75868.1 uroporphyrinogen decarboxylase family protein [Phycisphaerae bacterium]HOM53285.1 uroporphyrinogen decarboxylase family protein [Phycisphaerae bacterium]HON67265.1 uroporphyrinogen decarboxylase family protein [Phycisphaerae bacterium]HOQ85552.1 uroporphyrinogen decarboxylase family protein [Phycisphaerae bacterium]